MSEAPAFCHHCGANLRADEPIDVDGWRVSTLGAEHNGVLARLTAYEAVILHSIAVAVGRPVAAHILAEGIGYDGDHNVVQVLISRLRKRLPGVPIETVHGRGYRWRRSFAEAA